MTSEELQRRQQRAETEPMVIARSGPDFRVHSPAMSGPGFVVSGLGEHPSCTCPDFEHHADDPEWRCKHILAVQGRFGSPEAEPLPAEGQGGVRAGNGATQMLLKRSVSPDGRIDSLSVEFSSPLNGEPISTVQHSADRILDLQQAIVGRFLARNGRVSNGPEVPAGNSGEPVAAELVGIRGADGRWGRRLYLTVRAGDRYLRLYGSRKQIADHLASAGYSEYGDALHEGVQLGLPCRVVTRPVKGSRFLNIEEVLPPSGRPS